MTLNLSYINLFLLGQRIFRGLAFRYNAFRKGMIKEAVVMFGVRSQPWTDTCISVSFSLSPVMVVSRKSSGGCR